MQFRRYTRACLLLLLPKKKLVSIFTCAIFGRQVNTQTTVIRNSDFEFIASLAILQYVYVWVLIRRWLPDVQKKQDEHQFKVKLAPVPIRFDSKAGSNRNWTPTIPTHVN
jgi:hypothetical protein